MTLLITVIAAVICTVIWYVCEKARKLKISTLCFMYWSASLMWLVDAVIEYLETGAEFFAPATSDMLNDGFLGLSAATLGMVIWVITVIVKDPNGTVKAAFAKRK